MTVSGPFTHTSVVPKPEPEPATATATATTILRTLGLAVLGWRRAAISPLHLR